MKALPRKLTTKAYSESLSRSLATGLVALALGVYEEAHGSMVETTRVHEPTVIDRLCRDATRSIWARCGQVSDYRVLSALTKASCRGIHVVLVVDGPSRPDVARRLVRAGARVRLAKKSIIGKGLANSVNTSAIVIDGSTAWEGAWRWASHEWVGSSAISRPTKSYGPFEVIGAGHGYANLWQAIVEGSKPLGKLPM